MYIENSIEISYSGEYETSLCFSAPSTTYPASLLGLTDDPLVEWMRTKPQHHEQCSNSQWDFHTAHGEQFA